jgi:hypothetical protein
MKKYFLFITAFIVLIFSSCEEDINLQLLGSAQKIVIEGSIENDKTAEVIITRNSPLSQAIDFGSILVSDAKVYVTAGGIVDTLHLDTLLTTSVPFVYVGKKIKGVAGQSYSLTVIADNKLFSASTTIPYPIPLDTVWWKASPPEVDLGTATARLTDPVGYGNSYKWFAKRPVKIKLDASNMPIILNRRYISPLGSTFDDKFIDGKSFEFSYGRGYDPTESIISENEDQRERGLYKKTDTIYIKFCTIDLEAAAFYKTFESAASSNGNPFASPSSIMSNISGGALGVWAGFGASYDTIMPPK